MPEQYKLLRPYKVRSQRRDILELQYNDKKRFVNKIFEINLKLNKRCVCVTRN